MTVLLSLLLKSAVRQCLHLPVISVREKSHAFLLKSHTSFYNCTIENGIFRVAWVRSEGKLTLNGQTDGARTPHGIYCKLAMCSKGLNSLTFWKSCHVWRICWVPSVTCTCRAYWSLLPLAHHGSVILDNGFKLFYINL